MRLCYCQKGHKTNYEDNSTSTQHLPKLPMNVNINNLYKKEKEQYLFKFFENTKK